MMMLVFWVIGDLAVSEDDKHTPGAAQASVGPETKRFWLCPGRFIIGTATNERPQARTADLRLNSASLRFLR